MHDCISGAQQSSRQLNTSLPGGCASARMVCKRSCCGGGGGGGGGGDGGGHHYFCAHTPLGRRGVPMSMRFRVYSPGLYRANLDHSSSLPSSREATVGKQVRVNGGGGGTRSPKSRSKRDQTTTEKYKKKRTPALARIQTLTPAPHPVLLFSRIKGTHTRPGQGTGRHGRADTADKCNNKKPRRKKTSSHHRAAPAWQESGQKRPRHKPTTFRWRIRSQTGPMPRPGEEGWRGLVHA